MADKPERWNHERTFCGCCGDVEGPKHALNWWCDRCIPHIAPQSHDTPPWDRTYFAQHGVDCPFAPKEKVVNG